MIAAIPAPFFHEGAQEVRFYVLVDDEAVGASIGRVALHYRYCPTAQGEDPLETFRAHAVEIEAAVRRRVGAGALKPVLLRENDLAARAATT